MQRPGIEGLFPQQVAKRGRRKTLMRISRRRVVEEIRRTEGGKIIRSVEEKREAKNGKGQ
jgi:hypothetical protein